MRHASTDTPSSNTLVAILYVQPWTFRTRSYGTKKIAYTHMSKYTPKYTDTYGTEHIERSYHIKNKHYNITLNMPASQGSTTRQSLLALRAISSLNFECFSLIVTPGIMCLFQSIQSPYGRAIGTC